MGPIFVSSEVVRSSFYQKILVLYLLICTHIHTFIVWEEVGRWSKNVHFLSTFSFHRKCQRKEFKKSQNIVNIVCEPPLRSFQDVPQPSTPYYPLLKLFLLRQGKAFFISLLNLDEVHTLMLNYFYHNGSKCFPKIAFNTCIWQYFSKILGDFLFQIPGTYFWCLDFSPMQSHYRKVAR